MSEAQEPKYRVINDAEEIAAIARQARTPLEEIYFERTGPVCMKWRHYLALYDRYLSPYETSRSDCWRSASRAADRS